MRLSGLLSLVQTSFINVKHVHQRSKEQGTVEMNMDMKVLNFKLEKLKLAKRPMRSLLQSVLSLILQTFLFCFGKLTATLKHVKSSGSQFMSLQDSSSSQLNLLQLHLNNTKVGSSNKKTSLEGKNNG